MHRAYLVAWGAMLSVALASAENTPVVYKCTKADGSVVFAETPCGAGATVVDTSRALLRGDAPNLQGVSDIAAMAAIDNDCRVRAAALSDRYRQDYAAVDREANRLRVEMSRSTNSYAGATRDNGIRTQLAAIEQRRTDLARGEREERAALVRECDEARRIERKRQADRDHDAATKGESGNP